MLTLAGGLLGCSSAKNPEFVEKPVTPQPAIQAALAVPPGVPAPPNLPLRAPTSADVQAVVKRVFADTVVLDPEDRRPYIFGDFNADQSQDVAVLLKPVLAKLPQINDPLANWIIQDPHKTFVPPKDKRVVTMPLPPPREAVRAGDTLLALIHGVGPSGFRNPIAIQTFVMRNAVGEDLTVSSASPALRKDAGGLPPEQNVIAESLNGDTGVLYWTGAGYAWHKESVPVRIASATKKQPR
jgi:hypothetical protein